MTDTLYADNHTTGGMPPSACWAPMKPDAFAARRLREAIDEEARLREEVRLRDEAHQRLREEARLRQRDELYADDLTTGGYAPERCCAPVKDRTTLLRLRAAREKLARQELYANTPTTGFRPPEECRAPARGGKRPASDQ